MIEGGRREDEGSMPSKENGEWCMKQLIIIVNEKRAHRGIAKKLSGRDTPQNKEGNRLSSTVWAAPPL